MSVLSVALNEFAEAAKKSLAADAKVAVQNAAASTLAKLPDEKTLAARVRENPIYKRALRSLPADLQQQADTVLLDAALTSMLQTLAKVLKEKAA